MVVCLETASSLQAKIRNKRISDRDKERERERECCSREIKKDC